ncbi:MAG: ABC transporter substrate-binding protein [Nesterenkonia sp.]
MNGLSRRHFFGAASAAGGALTVAAGAAQQQQPSETGSEEPDRRDGRIVVASMSPPQSLDPGLSTDTETQRILRQIFEPLLGIEPDTGAVTALLATDWQISDDELTYTFTLRSDVAFHDGSELTAEVVAANIERTGRLDYLYGFGNISRSTALAFPTVFGGFIGGEECVLESVEAEDSGTLVITLTEPVAHLLQAMTLPAFGIASAEVLTDSDPEMVSRRPMGTGPYRLVPTEGQETMLEINSDYWGSLNGPDEVVVRPLPKSFDRLRELNRGTVDVYDGITAKSLRSLLQAGRLILQRDPFSILYLGFNMSHPVMADDDVRRAAAMAINRTALVEDHFLDGTRPAYQFTPPAMGVHSDAAEPYSHDLAEAQELLQDSDYDGEPLTFYYPITTTRNYLPKPEAVFASIAADLTAAGFTINPKPVKWADGYTDALMGDADRAMHLLGRSGGFRSPHAFLGRLFGQVSREFNYANEEVAELLDEARAEAEDEPRAALYREAAELLADDLPALPLAYPISGLALGPRVADYPMSPVLDERFNEIVLSDQE